MGQAELCFVAEPLDADYIQPTMRPDSRQSLHFGVNFVFAPLPVLGGARARQFQQFLAEEGVEFQQTGTQPEALVFQRTGPAPLEVRVAQIPPQLGQLLVIAAQPNRLLVDFEADAVVVCEVFRRAWPGNFQVVARDCTIRHLYQSQGDHAFQYLWERRLNQRGEQLAQFKRPVLGGGLRFVMPPLEGDPNSAQVEVKIESFLVDSSKIFVDVGFAWPRPVEPNAPMDPVGMLHEVDSFASGEAVEFILGGQP